jgi:excisionase family DNA binding protein
MLDQKVIEVSLDELPAFLTVDEAAAVLRIGRTSGYVLCREWLESGGRSGLPCVQVGRQLRVPRAALVRMAGATGSIARRPISCLQPHLPTKPRLFPTSRHR